MNTQTQRLDRNVCTICINEDDDMNFVQTPCKHFFHHHCIINIVRPNCPVCKTDIQTFLEEQGIDHETIDQRIEQDNIRINESIADMNNSDDDDDNDIDDEIDEIDLSIENYFATKAWKYIYTDIIFDKIGSARKLFAKISELKEPGVFFYKYNVTEFISSMHNENLNSVVEWLPLHKIDNELHKSFAEKAYKKISSKKTDFAVMISINNDICEDDHDINITNYNSRYEDDFGEMNKEYIHTRIMSISQHTINQYIEHCSHGRYISGIKYKRLAYTDIVDSITNCKTSRDGYSEDEINPEYEWSTRYLRRLKSNIKKKLY